MQGDAHYPAIPAAFKKSRQNNILMTKLELLLSSQPIKIKYILFAKSTMHNMIKIEFWRTLGFGLLHTLFSILSCSVQFGCVLHCGFKNLWAGWSAVFYWDLDCFCAQHFRHLYHPKLFGRRLDIVLYLLGFYWRCLGILV